MNYPRSQFSKLLLNFWLSYGHCDICVTCATYGADGRDTYIHGHFLKFILATVNHYLVRKYSNVNQFAKIYMSQYLRLPLVP